MSQLLHFHFLRPWLLLALIPTGLLWWRLWQQRFQTTSNWDKVIDPALLPYLIKNHTRQIHHKFGWGFLGLAWLIACLALAGPSWQQRNIPVFKHGIGTVLVVDLSPNILATDLSPTRLARARYKIRDLLEIPEGEIGLVVYSGESYVVSPITEDHKTIAAFLNDLSPDIMPVAGQNISAGLDKAAELLAQNNNEGGEIVLISSASQVNQAALDTAKKRHSQGFTITVLGLGTTEGAPLKLDSGEFIKNAQGDIIISRLNQDGLAKLAQLGGGSYIPFTHDSNDVDAIKQHLLHQHFQTKRKAEKEQHIIRWLDQGYFLVWLILPLALLSFRRGWMEKYLG